MAEEAKKLTTEEVVVSNVCVTETPTSAVVEKEAPPHPELEAEKVEKPAAEEVVDGEKEATTVEDDKIAESASFKEESNKIDDLIDPQKKALDEFKQLIQEVRIHSSSAGQGGGIKNQREERRRIKA
ncbi:unnamed protein product [Fraxinus pennsylvanica]|uniref:Uncharacterized protein n=1 Tax=Fraxinus pennsylvanica TaxID=56036 RepID=A0AAD1Z0Y8_9LAMI|nr:unnamed protein product [Fraxinus pennsylvanica]